MPHLLLCGNQISGAPRHRRDGYLSAEQELHWNEIKARVHGVRKYGSYKRYARRFHRELLACRGLAQRGKLSTNDPVLNFLARLGDRGVVWHILEYWRAKD